jgi:hypothetical protein
MTLNSRGELSRSLFDGVADIPGIMREKLFPVHVKTFAELYRLCQTALFETQTKQREYPSPVSRRQTIVFFSVILGVTLWQFLPEFIFPFLSSLAFLCWVAPRSGVANFMGSGLGGMGFLNLTFDWSNINAIDGMGNLFVTPWYTQVIAFAAFVVNCWILLPIAKWGKLAVWNHHLMSNDAFLRRIHRPIFLESADIHRKRNHLPGYFDRNTADDAEYNSLCGIRHPLCRCPAAVEYVLRLRFLHLCLGLDGILRVLSHQSHPQQIHGAMEIPREDVGL